MKEKASFVPRELSWTTMKLRTQYNVCFDVFKRNDLEICMISQHNPLVDTTCDFYLHALVQSKNTYFHTI